MPTRLYSVFVLTAWLCSMGWLVVAKVWPTLHGGDPPDYSLRVAEAPQTEPPTAWRILWKDRRIGTAASQIYAREDGTAVRYVVQFERMPLDMMLSEAFGVLGTFLFGDRHGAASPPANVAEGSEADLPRDELPRDRADGPDPAWQLDMLLATELRFDRQQRFQGFRTIGDIGEMPEVLRLRGEVNDERMLILTTQIATPLLNGAKPLRHELDLPANAVVQDAFAPRAELRNLRVGQKWTIPVYRPFPPNSPVRIVAAEAVRHELVLWDGRDVETILVEYYDDAGSGLQATREPIAREWVGQDGLVLQQEIQWSGTVIRFERLPDPVREPLTKQLRDDLYPRWWPTHD